MSSNHSVGVAPAMPLEIGERVLDRYRVVERIAAGGTSVVYRADDERLDRPVCVKVFHQLRASPRAHRASYDCFVREAFALSRLGHPNTLRIYDFGYVGEGDDGRPVQVSEYMNAGTLFARVRRSGALPPDQALRVAIALCDALAEAHNSGIIHRDIKPKNILFGTAGGMRPKLADFGIATSTGRDANATGGDGGGTLRMFSQRWAAPEQIVGGPVDSRTDIYSLALVTHFMLAGRPLLSVCNPDESYREREYTSLMLERSLAGLALPRSLISLLKDACNTPPEGRPADAATFARALEDCRSQRSDNAARAEQQENDAPDPGAPRPEVADTALILRVSDEGQLACGRVVRFVGIGRGPLELSCPGGGGRMRVAYAPSVHHRSALHIKPRGGFVRPVGGRVTRALVATHDLALELVDPRHRVLERLSLSFGRVQETDTVFNVGSEQVAVPRAECARPVLIDFAAGGTSYFVFASTAETRADAEQTAKEPPA